MLVGLGVATVSACQARVLPALSAHYLPRTICTLSANTQALVAELGAGRCRWAELARRMGTRTGKQCREACIPLCLTPSLYLRPHPEPHITPIRAPYPPALALLHLCSHHSCLTPLPSPSP